MAEFGEGCIDDRRLPKRLLCSGDGRGIVVELDLRDRYEDGFDVFGKVADGHGEC